LAEGEAEEFIRRFADTARVAADEPDTSLLALFAPPPNQPQRPSLGPSVVNARARAFRVEGEGYSLRDLARLSSPGLGGSLDGAARLARALLGDLSSGISEDFVARHSQGAARIVAGLGMPERLVVVHDPRSIEFSTAILWAAMTGCLVELPGDPDDPRIAIQSVTQAGRTAFAASFAWLSRLPGEVLAELTVVTPLDQFLPTRIALAAAAHRPILLTLADRDTGTLGFATMSIDRPPDPSRGFVLDWTGPDTQVLGFNGLLVPPRVIGVLTKGGMRTRFRAVTDPDGRVGFLGSAEQFTTWAGTGYHWRAAELVLAGMPGTTDVAVTTAELGARPRSVAALARTPEDAQGQRDQLRAIRELWPSRLPHLSVVRMLDALPRRHGGPVDYGRLRVLTSE
jgi:hypothetical protein